MMSRNDTASQGATVEVRHVCDDEEPTQRIEILALTEDDTACAAWMKRGREQAQRRDQRRGL